MSKRKTKWRKPPKRNGQSENPDKYVQSDIMDAIRFRAWMNGAQMREDEQWIVQEKNIPAAWYAIGVLAPENGITCVSREATEGKDGYWYAVAIVRKGDGILASKRSGAGRYHEKQIALAFACRNAIKWLLPQQPNTKDTPAWTGTKENMLAKELRDKGFSKEASQQHASEFYK